MNYANFHNRNDELDYLKKIFESQRFQFIPIWGRRRIGKTALILKAVGDRGVYFLASEITDLDNLKRFKDDAARDLQDPRILDLTSDWEIIFKYISEKDTIVVIDEFPYLISTNPDDLTIFNKSDNK